jgi:hypothetical protein
VTINVVTAGDQDMVDYAKDYLGPMFEKDHRASAKVTASFAELVNSRVIHPGPLGCLVVQGVAPPPAASEATVAAPALLASIAGPDLVEPVEASLEAVLGGAFAEPAAPLHRWTKRS